MASKRKKAILVPQVETGLKMLGKVKISSVGGMSSQSNYTECKCCYTQCTRCSKCKVVDGEDSYEKIVGW